MTTMKSEMANYNVECRIDCNDFVVNEKTVFGQSIRGAGAGNSPTFLCHRSKGGQKVHLKMLALGLKIAPGYTKGPLGVKH